MAQERGISECNRGGGFAKNGNKLTKFNWSQHADAHNNFLSQDKFLSSNFLLSLSDRRPTMTGSLRSVACQMKNVQSPHNLDMEKAWKVLSNLQISNRNYRRPGKSVSCVKHSVTGRNGGNPQPTPGEGNGIFKPIPTASSFATPSSEFDTFPKRVTTHRSTHCVMNGSSLEQNHSQKFSTASMTSTIAENGSCDNLQSFQVKNSMHPSVNGMDDDDILENIDVDQIIMEHYQSTSTPQPSKSIRFISDLSKHEMEEQENLPPELDTVCSHGCKLGYCQEASNHLQEMKDTLIVISNELIDNFDNLSAKDAEEFRHKRLELNKVIKQLEPHIHSTSVEERKRSHSFASPATTSHSQLQSPIESATDNFPWGNPGSFDNDVNPFMSWDASASFSSHDIFGQAHVPSLRGPSISNYDEVTCIEGSIDKKWSEDTFPWTKELDVNNKKVFGNHSFRPNQREVINATMSGCDAFVMMPTGGGKSLTYQLPALICPGITLVISPLVSLIQDQIMHLLQANISAAYLSATMDWTDQQNILRDLNSDYCKIKLLYVTPEKIAKSDMLLRHLENLYSRESLSRIVIDEAHCISQWGHDFRPDYQALGVLKKKFPNTPVLALTATATATVKEDVIRALGLANCIIFRQSFNRPNLCYSVIHKTRKCIEDIDRFIKENHFDECGIIYCLSRNDCEKVAEKLQELGHKAAFYHASMDPKKRAFVQMQWSKDDINIICATVAFGMGINKPDVRFVIHHSLPKSIEGYHQECGRAGRDGHRSSCVLYYSYSDFIRVKHMISQTSTESSPMVSSYGRTFTPGSDRLVETNTESLMRMVSYCENDVDCRRLIQLVHFGEKFDSTNCRKTCDNCSKVQKFIDKDVTEIAKQLIQIVKLTGQHFSSSHVLEVHRGSFNQQVKKYRHEKLSLHGAGKSLAKGDAARIIHHLVVEDFLTEDVKKIDIYASVVSVLKVNEAKTHGLLFGEHKIILRFPSTQEKASKTTRPVATPARGFLESAKLSPSMADVSIQVQPEVDLVLSSNLYSALRVLRTLLLKEAGEGVMAYHIFGNSLLQQISKRVPRSKEELLEISGMGKAKVMKYGDMVLDTIECTIKEYEKKRRPRNDGNDSTKRRREGMELSFEDHMRKGEGEGEDEDLVMMTTARSRGKRAVTSQSSMIEPVCLDWTEEDEVGFDDRDDPEDRLLHSRIKPGSKGRPPVDGNAAGVYTFKP